MSNEPPSVELWEYAQFEDAWENVIQPWFWKCLKAPHQKNIFLCPSTSLAVFIKSELLKANIPAVGVEFCTPGRMRKRLRDFYALEAPLALREDLHLLMRFAAEKSRNNPVAVSALSQPDQWVQLYDQLTKGGWGINDYPDEVVRSLLKQFQQNINRVGLKTAQELDFIFRQQNPESKGFDHLFVWGFSWRHWDAYTITQASIAHAREACVCFEVSSEMNEAALAWKGSWENTYNAFEEVPQAEVPVRRPYVGLFEKVTLPEHYILANPNIEVPDIGVVDTLFEEADLVLNKVCSFLADETCERVGIVLARETLPIGREISARLEQSEIPHFNHMGYKASITEQQRLFLAWADFQIEPRLKQWDLFLEYLKRHFPEMTATISQVRKHFSEAFRNVLTDDFAVLRAYVAEDSMSSESLCFLEDWRLLPEETLWANFVTSACQLLEKVGLPEQVTVIEARSKAFGASLEKPCLREYFMNWLTGIVASPLSTSGHIGQQVFSKVHLLSATDAVHQDWSHLIIVGMKQAEWPGEVKDVAPLSEETLYEYNQNAIRQGLHGEGDFCVKNGHAWILSNKDRNAYLRYCFYKLLQRTREKLVLTLSLKEKSGSGSEAVPSELLLQVISAVSGDLPEGVIFKALQEKSARFIAKTIECKKHQFSDFSGEIFLAVYQNRRNESTPFDEYSFGFKELDGDVLRLSCKAWEDVLKYPASAWYKHVLKLRPVKPDCEKDISLMAEGLWVHDWLCLKRIAQERPDSSLWLENTNKKAEMLQRRVRQAFQKAGRLLPDIWFEHWSAAKQTTARFIDLLEGESFSYLISEYEIPEDCNKARIYDIYLHGRIDLLASGSAFDFNRDNNENPAYVIDFKTGNMEPLNVKNATKGAGLQLVLYGLAIRQLGFLNVTLVLVKKGNTSLKKVNFEEFLGEEHLFKGLEKIALSGVFGDRGDKRSAFSYTGDYPMATLFIPPDVLEKKWALSNPLLEI